MPPILISRMNAFGAFLSTNKGRKDFSLSRLAGVWRSMSMDHRQLYFNMVRGQTACRTVTDINNQYRAMMAQGPAGKNKDRTSSFALFYREWRRRPGFKASPICTAMDLSRAAKEWNEMSAESKAKYRHMRNAEVNNHESDEAVFQRPRHCSQADVVQRLLQRLKAVLGNDFASKKYLPTVNKPPLIKSLTNYKPINPYQQFIKDQYDRNQRDISPSEQLKQLAIRWQQLKEHSPLLRQQHVQ